jgi:hypothetical protein
MRQQTMLGRIGRAWMVRGLVVVALSLSGCGTTAAPSASGAAATSAPVAATSPPVAATSAPTTAPKPAGTTTAPLAATEDLAAGEFPLAVNI